MGLSKNKYIDTKAGHFNSFSVFIPLILGLSKTLRVIDFWQNVEKNVLENHWWYWKTIGNTVLNDLRHFMPIYKYKLYRLIKGLDTVLCQFL